jgi:ABC-type branched-subunit amino acid transport system substrate-binding protein
LDLNVRSDGTVEPISYIDTGKLEDNQENNKLKIALLFPFSGRAERIGDMMFKAAQLSMFNHRISNVELLPFDTKGTDFGAVDAINSAIRSEADVIVGPFSTQETEAVIDIAKANNIIVMSVSDNQNLITKNRPNLYLLGLTPQQEIDRLISYLIDKQNFYAFSALLPSSIYGSSVSQDFTNVIRKKDAKIIKREFYTPNDQRLFLKTTELLGSVSYRDEAYKRYEQEKEVARRENLKLKVEFQYTEDDKIYTDGLLIPDSGVNLQRIGKFYDSYMGNKKPVLIGTSKWLNNNLYNDVNFENAYFTSPDPLNYVNFQNNFFDVFGVYPLRISSLVYDAITSLIESYAAAQDKENIKYALENYQGFDGINGKFRYLHTGMLERKLCIMKIEKGKYNIVDYDDNPFLEY